MKIANILAPLRYNGVVHSVSSSFEEHEATHVLTVDTAQFWCTGKNHGATSEYIIIDYGSIIAVTMIELLPSPSGRTTFPSEFRVECSSDGVNWGVLRAEYKYSLDDDAYQLLLPLTALRYVKVFIVRTKRIAAKYFSEIGSIQAGIQGAVSISASSCSSYDKDALNVLNNNAHKYWESEVTSSAARQWLDIDMGRVILLSHIGITSTRNAELFPEHFSIEYSEDKNIWTTLSEIKRFKAQPECSYIYGSSQFNARFIRINVTAVQTQKNKYYAQIAEVAALALCTADRMHSSVPYATIFQPGIVMLSANGEDRNGTVVQADDMRLRDASTIFKGIVQLAENGSSEKGVVQASDSRLAMATELKPGIVRLSYDREIMSGAVVQSTDSRLKEAAEDNFGVVKLCPDGKYMENAAVQGNDTRIQKATSQNFGIVRLAHNGEDNGLCVVQGNDRRLKDATIVAKGIVELAEDGEEREGAAVQGSDRRLKDATVHSKGIVELAEDGETVPGVAVQGSDCRLKDATVHSKGIVELAEDGENVPGVAVQGNDRRLKDATVHSKGIVELAEDGEEREGTAVQGNDRRLKDATVHSKGIVELAEDGENVPGVAVQGNDRRLKDATVHSKGIVELAEDGEEREGVAVQGNDRRLKDATVHSKGIVELAEDGETVPGVAVQGNDRRLKDATIVSKGIVELAEDGEEREGVAVQGNDRRLKDATVYSKGIVELAEDGEEREGVAVQGSDRRLKEATESTPGIVMLAKHGHSRQKHVVQSDDPRLFDKRESFPHEHEYAPLVHSFESHSGTIAITSEKSEEFVDIVPPPQDSAVLYGKNISNKSNAIGVAGIAHNKDGVHVKAYGVLGHASMCGVRGQSQGDLDNAHGCGVLGISRFGAGGVFASEHNYSLVADGYGAIGKYDDTVHLTGNGKALYVNGESRFKGKIVLDADSKEHYANIVEMFETDEQEFIAPGDVLVVSAQGNAMLSRSRTAFNKGVIGIVAAHSAIVVSNTSAQTKLYPVAITGSAMCKVDARHKPVKPGDLLVTSDTPGCAMASAVDSFDKIGTVFAKALSALDEGIALIPVMIWKV